MIDAKQQKKGTRLRNAWLDCELNPFLTNKLDDQNAEVINTHIEQDASSSSRFV